MAKAKKKEEAAPVPVAPVAFKLDLGCGTNKREGFVGVDAIKFDGVDVVHNLAIHRWPWADNSVDEVHCSHMIEHLTWTERVFFFNELYRVLKPGATATVILPHWCSARYYGDPTHLAPFSEWGWLYLNKDWRQSQAPHADSEKAPGPLAYSCDFDHTMGYNPAAWMAGRSADFQSFAFAAYKEAAQDMIGTLKKKPPK